MYVNRVHLIRVKSLNRDVPEGGNALPEAARRRLLLQGGNGSGKTTILETVATLWRLFGAWLDAGNGEAVRPEWASHYLAQSELAAVEFCGFDAGIESLWIGVGRGKPWRDLIKEHPRSQFAGMIAHGTTKTEQVFTLEFPTYDFAMLCTQMLLGKISRPNVVYFSSEDRDLSIPPMDRPPISMNLAYYHWIADYRAGIGIDHLLMSAKSTDSGRYDLAVKLINQMLAVQPKKLVLREQNNRHEVQIGKATENG